METVVEQNPVAFLDRRSGTRTGRPDGAERRQFSASTNELSPAVAELAEAIDRYKLLHRRRFINFEELHAVITGLGYHK
uniref:Uncharacterized protein n=1 Tax=Schlesneria paludicola TaxID=360056 RepID=A0A7C2K212_9PLAN